jgi:hypothetical protein
MTRLDICRFGRYSESRVCRNFLLKVLGKIKINNLNLAGNDRF